MAFCYLTQHGTCNSVLSLLPWTKNSLERVKNQHELGVMEWYLYPKDLWGSSLLNLENHIISRKCSLLKGICVGTQPWVEIICYFMEKVGTHYCKTKNVASWWHIVNNEWWFKCSKSIMVQQLVFSWQISLELVNLQPSECKNDFQRCSHLHDHYIWMEREITSVSLIIWKVLAC